MNNGSLKLIICQKAATNCRIFIFAGIQEKFGLALQICRHMPLPSVSQTPIQKIMVPGFKKNLQ